MDSAEPDRFRTSSFVRAGLRNGEAVLVAAPGVTVWLEWAAQQEAANAPAGAELAADVRDWMLRTHLYRMVLTPRSVLSAPLPEHEGDQVAAVDFDRTALARVRALIGQYAPRLGLDRPGEIDLALVASELASNSVTHGGGAGTLRLWRDSFYAVCEVRDSGLITDPFVGLRRPDFRKRVGGAGLWAVSRACALVIVRSSREFGTVVRAHLPAAA